MTDSPSSGFLNENYLHIWLNVGDTGPDQATMRGSLRTMFASRSDFAGMLFLSAGCLKHQYHLITGSQLKLVDFILKTIGKKMKYFSSLATMSHTWRAYMKKMRSTWVTLHHGTPTERNKFILYKTPPLAIAGRWASIDGNLAELLHNSLLCVTLLWLPLDHQFNMSLSTPTYQLPTDSLKK